jgi:hypothetical protein
MSALSRRAPFKFTDQQWTSLSHPLGLPTAARTELQSTIDIFLKFRDNSAAQLPARKMKKQLNAISRDCDRLLRGLKGLDRRAVRALIGDNDASSPTRARDGLDKFVDRQEQILALRKWCDLTVKRTGADASGPAAQAGNLEWLVRGIGGVLERHKSQPLRRTKLIVSFVEEACQIAHPNIGSSSIDEAMKSVMRANRTSAATAG